MVDHITQGLIMTGVYPPTGFLSGLPTVTTEDLHAMDREMLTALYRTPKEFERILNSHPPEEECPIVLVLREGVPLQALSSST